MQWSEKLFKQTALTCPNTATKINTRERKLYDFNTMMVSFSAMSSITYKLLVNLGISDILITCLCGTVNLFQTHILGKFQVCI